MPMEAKPDTVLEVTIDEMGKNLKRLSYKTLLRIQREVEKDAIKNPEKFFTHPDRDFTRTGKLGLEKLIKILFHFDEDSVLQMLREMYKNNEENRPTPQAVSACRRKVKEYFFEYLFFRYTKAVNRILSKYREYTSCTLFRGIYHVLAVDGSDFTALSDPGCQEAYFVGQKGTKGYNMYHLNAVYNVMTGVFEDAMIKGRYKDSERAALLEMADRISSTANDWVRKHTILMADRGYQGIDTIARLIKSGMYYIIRIIEPNTDGSAFHDPEIPSDQETYDFERTIRVRYYKDTSKKKANPDGRRWKKLKLKDDGSYPGNPGKLPEKDMYMRIIKLKIKVTEKDENGNEVGKIVSVYLATNLPKEVTPEEIGELYQKRWKIENAFRDLKKAVKAEKLHTRKASLIMQEIWIHLTMFNYAAATGNFFAPRQGRKLERKLSFRSLYSCCSELLWSKGHYSAFEEDVDNGRTSIRPNRHYERRLPDDNANQKKKRQKKKAQKAAEKKNSVIQTEKPQKVQPVEAV